MPSVQPYQIINIDLSQQTALAMPSMEGMGGYIIFWWETIALGHLFVEQGSQLSEPEYLQALKKAIEPAVKHLAAAINNEQQNGTGLLQSPDFKTLKATLEPLLSPLQPQALPHTVPVSVIICTRNRPDVLEACLQSLHAMPCQPQEIIIVDNAPVDNRTELAVARHAGVRYVVEPEPGLSRARNKGVLLAQCPIIAFTDDDVHVHTHWAFRIAQAFEDGEVAALTGLVLAQELTTPSQVIFEKRWPFNRGFTPVRYDRNYLEQHKKNGAPVWELGAGANMAFRKDVFEKAGLFDVRLGAGASGCNEDSEMWFRILRQGDTLVYAPEAIVYHQHRRDMQGLRRQLYHYMKGFVVAAMVQHHQWPAGGYKRRVQRNLPIYYASLIKNAIPFFPARFRTLHNEIAGVLSGYLYYLRHHKELRNHYTSK